MTAMSARHASISPSRMRGLAPWSTTTAQFRMPLQHAREPRQVPRQHQRIEDEAMRDHRVERRAKRGTQQPIVVGFVLHHRPQADERRSTASAAIRSAASGASNGAQPTTPATNGVAAASSSSHRVSATVGAACTRIVASMRAAREDGREIGGPEIAVDRAERGREPTVVAAIDPPEVLVRVDRPRAARSGWRRARRDRIRRTGLRSHGVHTNVSGSTATTDPAIANDIAAGGNAMRRMLIGFALAAAFAAPAPAQQVTIRWGDVVGGTHPSVQMIDRIAAEAKEKSGGRIVIQSFPAGQLGGSRDMIDAVANGAQQVVTEGAANFGAWVPSISVVEAPYIWRDAAHLDKAMNGPIGAEFNDTLVKARGMRILGTTYYGTRHITTTAKEVKSPADMVGFKLRVPENDVFKAMAEAWGAKPTPMNFGELYLALKQNVVDGQENPLPTIKSGKFDEVQKYLVLSGAHHHAAARRHQRGVLAGPVRRRPQDHRRRREERHRVAERRAHQAGRLARRHVQGGRDDGDHARSQRVPRARARQGAEDVRVEVGSGHVRPDPGRALTTPASGAD